MKQSLLIKFEIQICKVTTKLWTLKGPFHKTIDMFSGGIWYENKCHVILFVIFLALSYNFIFEYSTHLFITVISTYFTRHVSGPMAVISLSVSGSGSWLVDVSGHMVTSCDLVTLVWRHSSLLFIAFAPSVPIFVASAICRVRAVVKMPVTLAWYVGNVGLSLCLSVACL